MSKKIKEGSQELKERIQKMPALHVLASINDSERLAEDEYDALIDRTAEIYPFGVLFDLIDILQNRVKELEKNFKNHDHYNGRIVRGI